MICISIVHSQRNRTKPKDIAYGLYMKDRTEMFDDDFPCRKDNCKLVHITNWLKLFVDMYNQIK